jgi:hypothetical protein
MAKEYGPEEMGVLRKEAYLNGNNYSRLELEEIYEKYIIAYSESKLTLVYVTYSRKRRRDE